MVAGGAKEKAKKILEAERERVSKELEKKTEEVEALKAEERCLRATLKELGQDRQDRSKKAKKPAAKKADVVKTAIAVLQAGPLARAELRKAVSERLRSDHSLSGFSVSFKEALKSPEFVMEGESIQLAEKERRAGGEASRRGGTK
jgi:hypothetical protein